MSKDYVGGGIELGEHPVRIGASSEWLGELKALSVVLPFAQWIIDTKRYSPKRKKILRGCVVIGLYLEVPQGMMITLCHLFVLKGIKVYQAYSVSRLKLGDAWNQETGRSIAYTRAIREIAQQMKGVEQKFGFILSAGGMHFGPLHG